MKIHPIWFLFIIIVSDIIIFFIADLLDMRNTPAQRTFTVILAAIINVLFIMRLGG